jgi:hypothetical protein
MLVQPCRSTCGVQERWSTAEVKVMRAHADGPVAVKGECWVLTDGSEQPGDQMWWLTPRTHLCARTWWGGPCFRRGRGLAGQVSDRGGRARGAVLHDKFGGLGLKTTQRHEWLVLLSLGLKTRRCGSGGNRWWHRRDRGGCVKAKQLRVKDVAVGSKT